MKPQALPFTPPPTPLNGGAKSLHTLLSVWEAAGQSDEQLDSLCRQHPDLASDLRSQAAALRRVGNVLQRAATEDTKPRVPGYELLRVLGEGGMGTVWEARQLSANRHVALKLLPVHHLGSTRAQARFEREVELASRLDHPHIARLYDSGLDRGVYYFSMELVAGRPIDEHPFPSLRVALETLILVAHALTHAHNRRVHHRDLKPSNLLVSSDHQPHLLDFGLARDLTVDSTLTLELPFAGTPGYCAPEQARGQPSDVTGDTFSLGLIAIRVLLGQHPLDLTQPPQKLLQQLAHQPVRLPPNPPGSPLPPDLLAVLRKAVAFYPADRYASADAFAADLQAVLDHRPVSARRPSLAYLSRRFLQRHRRAAMIAAAALVITVTAGTVFTARIASEQARASRSAAVAVEANRFLTDLLTAANPEVAQGRTLTVRDLLDTASKRIDQSNLDPEVEAHVRNAIGMSLFHIALASDYPEALAHIRRAHELRTRHLGPTHSDTINTRMNLARVLSARPETLEEGFDILRSVVDDLVRVRGLNDRFTLDALYALGAMYSNNGRVDDLEAHLNTFQSTIDRTIDTSPLLRPNWSSLYAPLYFKRRDFDALTKLTAERVEDERSKHGELHTRTARAYLNYGIVLGWAGRPEEALQPLQTSLDLRIQILGDKHPDTDYARINVATVHIKLGNHDQARALLQFVAANTEGDAAYAARANELLGEIPPPQPNLSTLEPGSR